MKMRLDVLSDLSECIPYNIPDIPLHISIGELKNFHRYTTACHWHPDIEISLPLEGSMDFFVNGETHCVPPGQGIFINSKRLHYNYSAVGNNCKYLVMTFNPFALQKDHGSFSAFLEEKFGSPNEDIILLTREKLWHVNILQNVHQIYEETQSANCDILRVLSLAFATCSSVRENIKKTAQSQPPSENWLIIWKMTGFIHKHYGDKISLDDIAEAGAVCRTKCCEMFSQHFNRTPIAYLTDYRIQKSYEMLRGTACTITEVALSCGFQSASYYAYVFRKETGITPRKYRQNIANYVK